MTGHENDGLCPVCRCVREIEPLTKVCAPCGEDIANGYWMHRSGRWLTRPNPVAVKPMRAHRTLSKDLREAVFHRDGHRCAICGTSDDLTLDHIVAQANGGGHTLDNLRTLCRTHNSSKGKR